jgi:hypothetical protein
LFSLITKFVVLPIIRASSPFKCAAPTFVRHSIYPEFQPDENLSEFCEKNRKKAISGQVDCQLTNNVFSKTGKREYAYKGEDRKLRATPGSVQTRALISGCIVKCVPGTVR